MHKDIKINLTFILVIMVGLPCLYWGCKKDNPADPPAANSIIGKWKFNYGIKKIFDTNNQVTFTDTLRYVDLLGQPMTVFEEYTTDNKYFMFRNSFDDTLYSYTYTKKNNLLTIHFPGIENERTISNISQTDLELFHLYQDMIPKQSLTQFYIRVK